MALRLFRTVWGAEGSLADTCASVVAAGWDGLEADAPRDPASRAAFFETLAAHRLQWIAEVSTCTPAGVYVPLPGRSPEEHLESLRCGVAAALGGAPHGCPPQFVNTMGGSDAWTLAEAVRFAEGVVELQDAHSLPVCLETHRGRYTRDAFLTRDLLRAVPGLLITADFSHWVVVAERMVLDEQPEILELACSRAYHVQTRVGYEQGPQVPDPRAPEFAGPLESHERWWDLALDMAARRHSPTAGPTVTPEFGPAAGGYLQAAPYTRHPAVASLWDVNRWVGDRQRARRRAARPAAAAAAGCRPPAAAARAARAALARAAAAVAR